MLLIQLFAQYAYGFAMSGLSVFIIDAFFLTGVYFLLFSCHACHSATNRLFLFYRRLRNEKHGGLETFGLGFDVFQEQFIADFSVWPTSRKMHRSIIPDLSKS